MGTWYNAREDEWVEFDPPPIEVWETVNPIVGTLLGPDGGIVATFTERPIRPFGFQAGSDA